MLFRLLIGQPSAITSHPVQQSPNSIVANSTRLDDSRPPSFLSFFFFFFFYFFCRDITTARTHAARPTTDLPLSLSRLITDKKLYTRYSFLPISNLLFLPSLFLTSLSLYMYIGASVYVYIYVAWFSSDFDPIPCSRAIESWIIVAVETVGNGCLRVYTGV